MKIVEIVPKALQVHILIDRSYSMVGKWRSTIESVNDYVAKLQENGTDAILTVSVFDSEQVPVVDAINNGNGFNCWVPQRNELKFEVLFIASTDTWRNIDYKNPDVQPRGGTPLFDATAKALGGLESLAAGGSKCVLFVLSDGEENTSTNTTQSQIKERIKAFTDNGNEVILMGLDFNTAQTALSFGLAQTKNLDATQANYGATMAYYADATRSFSAGQAFDTSAVKDNFNK